MVSRHTSTHPTDGEVSYYRCRSLYLTEAGSAASREVALYDQAFVDTFIHPLANRGRVIAGQFDDPYQLNEKGSADILFPVLVRNADALGIYKVLGVPDATVTALKSPRADIINAFNLGRLRRHQRADRAEYPATLTGGQPGTQSIVDPAVAQ